MHLYTYNYDIRTDRIMNILEYINALNKKYIQNNATEYTYRGCLEDLIQSYLPNLIVTNEPKRIKCGAPDYIITRTDKQPIFYIEAKEIGDNDLDGRSKNKIQFTRYLSSLEHIIFTDYLDFHFYENGEWKENIRIGEIRGNELYAFTDQEDKFVSAIQQFANSKVQPMTSATKLAEIMAAKAKLLRINIFKILSLEDESYDNKQLRQLYDAFKNALIKDLTDEQFSDMYAQTIAYGLFAARLHDTTPDDFSRSEAVNLIPKSNPFLRQLFNSIAGIDLDERVAWIVDDLVQTFAATNVQKVMHHYSKNKRHNDPMIHFYEDFLKAYNPRLREKMGVYYTPQPIVTFIVKAVDEILKRDFHISAGLADKKTIPVNVIKPQEYDNRTKDGFKHVQKPYHRVQILDPATGTGTFLAEVINTIYYEISQKNAGIWQDYVSQHLLPRLNGFEILMASYAVAHLKLDMVLQDTGYVHNNDKRFNVFLTNSLENGTYEKRNLFYQALSAEMEQASEVKIDKPVMVMIGNPPYSVSSSNKGKWITELVADYKMNLNERNIQPLSDDYIKFLRLGQFYIDKNKQGIMAFITNNTFIDGVIHRQLRQSLLETFDDIYIVDLHGSTKKKEFAPDGSKDENVFDIQQGVSINIFVKRNEKSEGIGRVHHHELYGTRKIKYKKLDELDFEDIKWNDITLDDNYKFFVPKDFSLQDEYEQGFKLSELFVNNVSGIKTSKDAVNIWSSEKEVQKMADDILSMQEEEFRLKYKVGKDSRDWSIQRARADVKTARENNIFSIEPYMYRPFDIKYIAYTGKTNGIVAWPRYRSLHAMFSSKNLALCTIRINRDYHFAIAATNIIADKTFLSSKDDINIFLLYDFDKKKKNHLRPNFSRKILAMIEEKLVDKIVPEDLFDYIYAVLHSPSYRERYKEFLKIDFPRVPFPKDKKQYSDLVKKGNELRMLHLMIDSDEWDTETGFPETEGDNLVTEVKYDEVNERVYINKVRYFSSVPKVAWDFYLGAYQPARKWLNDRKNQQLSGDDVEHYEQIIYVLKRTQRIMTEIDSLIDFSDIH